jgi:hypothetical protein
MTATKKEPVIIQTAACYICHRTVEMSALYPGADLILCEVHSLVVHDAVAEQHRLAALRALIGRAEVEEAIDTNGCRYFKHIAPKPRKPQPISYDDDGTPRFLDTGSPHGQTVRPEVDRILGGSDPRLGQYRVTDDGE